MQVEITLDELAKYLFDDLNLPDLEKKADASVLAEKIKRKGIARGTWSWTITIRSIRNI